MHLPQPGILRVYFLWLVLVLLAVLILVSPGLCRRGRMIICMDTKGLSMIPESSQGSRFSHLPSSVLRSWMPTEAPAAFLALRYANISHFIRAMPLVSSDTTSAYAEEPLDG